MASWVLNKGANAVVAAARCFPASRAVTVGGDACWFAQVRSQIPAGEVAHFQVGLKVGFRLGDA